MSLNINAPRNSLPIAVLFDEVKKKPRTPTNTFPQGARIGTVKDRDRGHGHDDTRDINDGCIGGDAREPC
jgi:hypothetical protein